MEQNSFYSLILFFFNQSVLLYKYFLSCSIELDVWLSEDDQIVVAHRNSQTSDDHLRSSLVADADGNLPDVGHFKASERNKYLIKEPWFIFI